MTKSDWIFLGAGVILAFAVTEYNKGQKDSKSSQDTQTPSAYSTQPKSSKYAENIGHKTTSKSNGESDSENPAVVICDNEDIETCKSFYSNNCHNGDYMACIGVSGLYLMKDDFANTSKYMKMVCENMDTSTPFVTTYIDNKKQEIEVEYLKQMKSYACAGAKNYNTLQSFKDSCDSNDASGCHNLGFVYESGDLQGYDVIRQNYTMALEYFQKACDLDFAGSCANIGILYNTGSGGLEQSYTKALPYFKKACDLGAVNGCLNLAVLYGQGRGVPQDDYSAAKYFCKSCNLGHKSSCEKFAQVGYGMVFGDNCE